MSVHDPMDTETLANELARQEALLQEAQQAVLRLEQLTIQADQRSKVAEEKAIAAVTAIGMIKITEQRKVKVLASDVHGGPRGQEELRGVPWTGRDVLECSGTRLTGETAAERGCGLPRPGESDE